MNPNLNPHQGLGPRGPETVVPVASCECHNLRCGGVGLQDVCSLIASFSFVRHTNLLSRFKFWLRCSLGLVPEELSIDAFHVPPAEADVV